MSWLAGHNIVNWGTTVFPSKVEVNKFRMAFLIHLHAAPPKVLRGLILDQTTSYLGKNQLWLLSMNTMVGALDNKQFRIGYP